MSEGLGSTGILQGIYFLLCVCVVGVCVRVKEDIEKGHIIPFSFLV